MELSRIFASPLVTGASVSAGHLCPSPGHLLAKRHGLGRPKMVAWNGARGSQVLSRVTREMLQGSSVLIGIDLFFWDATGGDSATSLRAMGALVESTRELDLPVVLGTVPSILPFWQKSLERINDALLHLAAVHPHLHLLRLDELFARVVREGGVWRGGRHIPLSSLIPDGLHSGREACEYLADEIEKALQSDSTAAALTPIISPGSDPDPARL